MNNLQIKPSKADLVFDMINYSLLTLLLILVIYPLIYILSASFSSVSAVTTGQVWLWPVELNVEGYRAVFRYNLIWSGYMNSILYTVVGTAVNVVVTIMAAYPLSRRDFWGRNGFMVFFVLTMMFSGGLIPTYLLVRDLGLLNTRWSMILPPALNVFNMIVMRTYFMATIPTELLEAAQMDGCRNTKFILKIVLPLSGPIIAVISLFYAVSHWNQYFNALIYLKSSELFPLQIVLREILIQNKMSTEYIAGDAQAFQDLSELIKYAVIIVATVPVLIIYPFVQKHFVKGVMVGSLKG